MKYGRNNWFSACVKCVLWIRTPKRFTLQLPMFKPNTYTLRQRPEQERWKGMQRFIKLGNIQRKGMWKGNTASTLKQCNNCDGEGPVIHIHMHEDTLVSGCDYAGSWGLSFTCTTYMCSARKNFISDHTHTCASVWGQHLICTHFSFELGSASTGKLCLFPFKISNISDYYKCNVDILVWV